MSTQSIKSEFGPAVDDHQYEDSCIDDHEGFSPEVTESDDPYSPDPFITSDGFGGSLRRDPVETAPNLSTSRFPSTSPDSNESEEDPKETGVSNVEIAEGGDITLDDILEEDNEDETNDDERDSSICAPQIPIEISSSPNTSPLSEDHVANVPNASDNTDQNSSPEHACWPDEFCRCQERESPAEIQGSLEDALEQLSLTHIDMSSAKNKFPWIGAFSLGPLPEALARLLVHYNTYYKFSAAQQKWKQQNMDSALWAIFKFEMNVSDYFKDIGHSKRVLALKVLKEKGLPVARRDIAFHSLRWSSTLVLRPSNASHVCLDEKLKKEFQDYFAQKAQKSREIMDDSRTIIDMFEYNMNTNVGDETSSGDEMDPKKFWEMLDIDDQLIYKKHNESRILSFKFDHVKVDLSEHTGLIHISMPFWDPEAEQDFEPSKLSDLEEVIGEYLEMKTLCDDRGTTYNIAYNDNQRLLDKFFFRNFKLGEFEFSVLENTTQVTSFSLQLPKEYKESAHTAMKNHCAHFHCTPTFNLVARPSEENRAFVVFDGFITLKEKRVPHEYSKELRSHLTIHKFISYCSSCYETSHTNINCPVAECWTCEEKGHLREQCPNMGREDARKQSEKDKRSRDARVRKQNMRSRNGSRRMSMAREGHAQSRSCSIISSSSGADVFLDALSRVPSTTHVATQPSQAPNPAVRPSERYDDEDDLPIRKRARFGFTSNRWHSPTPNSRPSFRLGIFTNGERPNCSSQSHHGTTSGGLSCSAVETVHSRPDELSRSNPFLCSPITHKERCIIGAPARSDGSTRVYSQLTQKLVEISSPVNMPAVGTVAGSLVGRVVESPLREPSFSPGHYLDYSPDIEPYAEPSADPSPGPSPDPSPESRASPAVPSPESCASPAVPSSSPAKGPRTRAKTRKRMLRKQGLFDEVIVIPTSSPSEREL